MIVNTYHNILAEVEWRSDIACIQVHKQWMDQIGQIRQAAQRYKTMPRQKGIHRT